MLQHQTLTKGDLMHKAQLRPSRLLKRRKIVMIDDRRLWFLRGVLATTASNRQTITCDEIRRLCRLNDEQLGIYLGKAREILEATEPDYCSIVVKTTGKPGEEWGDPEEGPSEAIRAQQYWQDRRFLDNKPFEEKYKSLPSVPGLSS
jgi:hypothetical protein